MSRVASVAQNGIPSIEDAPKPKPQSNLTTNELMLTSLGGPWANDPRLTDQQKTEGETGAKAGALSGFATIGSIVGGSELLAGAKALVPAATRGVMAIGEWAEAHPILARMVYEGVKGAAWYKTLKTIGKAVPDSK
jgi:hypothetical protein